MIIASLTNVKLTISIVTCDKMICHIKDDDNLMDLILKQ